MRAFRVFSRKVNAGTADGYSDWDNGTLYYADNTTEAEELYIDDVTEEMGYDVQEIDTNEFGNRVDFQLDDGSQFQITVAEPDLEDLTDEGLAGLFKANYRWDSELCEELIRRASMWDETGTIEDEWDDEKDGDDFETVLSRAADILEINIF